MNLPADPLFNCMAWSFRLMNDGWSRFDLDVLQHQESRNISILFHTSGQEWQFLKCHSLNWLVDGTPLPMPETTHDGDVGSGFVMEHIHVTVPPTVFLKLASAAAIRGRIYTTAFMLTVDQVRSLRSFAEQAGLLETPVR
jgi:hypothetical protein